MPGLTLVRSARLVTRVEEQVPGDAQWSFWRDVQTDDFEPSVGRKCGLISAFKLSHR